MREILTIRSVLHPNKLAYELDQGAFRGSSGTSAPLCSNILRFDTYGDGITKHSYSFPVQLSDFTDVCVSFARAILDEPRAPEWGQLSSRILNQYHGGVLRFALKVAHKEGKRQYYSLSQCKITTSDKARHDKRFEEVTERQNGTTKSAFNLLVRSHIEYLARVCMAYDLIEISDWSGAGYCGGVDSIIPELDRVPGDWRAGYYAFRCALEASDRLKRAAQHCDSAKSNWELAEETAALELAEKQRQQAAAPGEVAA